MRQRILVWDVPVRVFHWLLAVSFLGAYLTADSERYRDIHVVLGYTLLGLIVFRLLWGFFGTRYARFRSFFFRPGDVLVYARSMLGGRPMHYVGHNPLGSVAIWLLLGLGLTAGVSGVLLFEEVGGEALEALHEFASNAMITLILIHVAGVAVSSVLHRENLVRAMVTGFKTAAGEPGISRSHAWLGALMLVAVIAFWTGYPATGLMASDAETAHAGQERDDG